MKKTQISILSFVEKYEPQTSRSRVTCRFFTSKLLKFTKQAFNLKKNHFGREIYIEAHTLRYLKM